jgi:hypothetical protein
MAIHTVLLPIPLVVSIGALILAIQNPVGPRFFLFLSISILVGGLVPWLGYRMYALSRSLYVLEREGVHIQWGLRLEDIPMTDILWARPLKSLQTHIPLPRVRYPGAVLGTRRNGELGLIEYLAADLRHMILIATPQRTYAISPENPEAFLAAFQELTEMGSLTPMPARSVHPTSLVTRVWQDPWARYLLLAGLLMGGAVLIWVATLIPSQTAIAVGFSGTGAPRRPGPAVRLTLFPMLNTIFLLGNWVAGIFFYRQEENQFLAYVMWSAGIVTSSLFLVTVFLILRIT